jgi:hypothetical protein
VTPAQPVNTVALVQAAVAECSAALGDSSRRTATLTEYPIDLPDGSHATIRCSRTKAGGIRVTISQRPAV